MSLDSGASEDFGAHLSVLQAGKYSPENVANLKEVSPAGITIVVGGRSARAPLAAPSRVFAIAGELG